MMKKLSFDDVLDELMLEETKPDYEALVRWCDRYPQYRNELSEFFAIWAIQFDMPETVEIDEERLVEKGVKHAMEILRRQGRLIPDNEVASVDPFEELVLDAVHVLHGEGSGMKITEKVSEMLGKEVLLGSIRVTLARLEKRDLISSWRTDPKTEPEGKNRQYFTITLAGEHALAHAKAASKRLIDTLEDFA
jgi:DNA-binding PadR family transcriptional regulator